MMDVRFKLHPPVGGPGHWTYATLPGFLFSLPYLFLLHGGEQPIPPLAVLNEVFTAGKWDAGMSGRCEWKPFEISEHEYDELVQALAAAPNYRFVGDDALAEVKSLRQWRSKVLSKYSKRSSQTAE
jgi:hypothetical protein